MPRSKRSARRTGLRKGRWSKQELSRLRELWGRRSEEAIAREFNRSVDSVRKTAAGLFRGPRRSGPWTAQDVRRLRQGLGITTEQVLAQVLHRDVAEVHSKILELGRIQQSGRWSRDELNELKRIYGTLTDEVLAHRFGRSVQAVQRQAQRLCLAKDKAFLKSLNGTGTTRMPRWTPEELDLLRELYPEHPNLEIAQRLRRSQKSVVSKAHHLGLRKAPERLQQMGRENVGLRYRRAD